MSDALLELNSNGFYPDQIVADGHYHRFKADPNDKGKSGWYVANQIGTGIIVNYGNWKTGEKWTFKPKFSGLSNSEVNSYREKAIELSEKAKQEKEKSQDELADEFLFKWNSEDDWSDVNLTSLDYFKRKKIKAPDNLKCDFRKTIYIPMSVIGDPKLWSFQKIYPDGQKRFEKGGRIKGCSYVFGDIRSDIIYLCEGFATGASIHEATGQCVVVSFSASNMEAVAGQLKGKSAIVCGDDDKANTDNAGRKCANKAALVAKARCMFPVFKNGDAGSDFNDVHCLYGLKEVKAQLVDKVTDVVEYNQAPALTKDILANVLPHWRWSKATRDRPSERIVPLATIDNLKALLDHLGVILRYNVISKQEEVLIPARSFSIDNEAVASLAWIKSIQSQISMSNANVGEYMTILSEDNQYNPVATWIGSKPWDGISRLEDFYATIVAVGEDTDQRVLDLKKILLKRWAISAVAAAYLPRGLSAHGVLVLQGEQYIGKTAWLKALAPKDLDVVADGKILKPDDKDSVSQAIRYWIVELGELDATFRKADMAQLKAFLTKDTDLLRRAFAPKDSKFARRTVFFASVNSKQFLHDATGNRRFWTIECKAIGYAHGLDMQQIWAEFYSLFQSGEKWVLSYSEMKLLNDHNEGFLERDHVEELVASGLDWDANEQSWEWMTSSAVLKLFGIDSPRHMEKSKTTQAILRLNGSRKRVRRGYVQLYIPPHVRPVDCVNRDGRSTKKF